MKKSFIIKRKEQDQLYNIDLSLFSSDIDYKLILRLLTRDKHKNFIEDMVTHKVAFNLISFYLKSYVSPNFDVSNHYKYCYDKIGPASVHIITSSITESIDSIVYTEPSFLNLNQLKTK